MPAPQNRSARAGDCVIAVGSYAFSTLLVWGLFALDRGFFQDEPWCLVAARHGPRLLWLGNTLDVQPHRPLMGVPYLLAAFTPSPRATLQLFYGCTFLITAALLAAVARRALPARPLTAFLAGALAATATGDVAMNYVGAQTHWPALLYLAALLVALGARCGASWTRVAASTALMAASLWTAEIFLPAIAATPVLLWAIDGFRMTPRVRRLSGAWGLVLVPYVAVLGRFLTDHGGYAVQVLERPGISAWAVRAAWLFGLHFRPWAWADLFDRRFLTCVGNAVSPGWRAGFAMLGLAGFFGSALWLWRRARGAVGVPLLAVHVTPEGSRHFMPKASTVLAGWSLALLGAYSACFAFVGDWHAAYRTQLAPRLLASLLVALLTEALTRRLGRAWPLSLLLPALFVACGTWAGVASQDAYLTLWRAQRRELASIFEQAPGLRAGSWIMLQNDSSPNCPLATMYQEVGGEWLRYLYRRPGLPVIVRSPARPVTCTEESAGWRCNDPAAPPTTRLYPADKGLVFRLAPESGRYDLEAPKASMHGYRPDRVIDRHAPSSEAHALLFASERLARFFPARSRRPKGLPDPHLPASAFDVEWSDCALPSSVPAGKTFVVRVQALNASDVTWPGGHPGSLYVVRLSHRWHGPGGGSSPYEARVELPTWMEPGDRVQLEAELRAPTKPGDYSVQFDLLLEGVAWFEAQGARRLDCSISVRPAS